MKVITQKVRFHGPPPQWAHHGWVIENVEIDYMNNTGLTNWTRKVIVDGSRVYFQIPTPTEERIHKGLLNYYNSELKRMNF